MLAASRSDRDCGQRDRGGKKRVRGLNGRALSEARFVHLLICDRQRGRGGRMRSRNPSLNVHTRIAQLVAIGIALILAHSSAQSAFAIGWGPTDFLVFGAPTFPD